MFGPRLWFGCWFGIGLGAMGGGWGILEERPIDQKSWLQDLGNRGSQWGRDCHRQVRAATCKGWLASAADSAPAPLVSASSVQFI